MLISGFAAEGLLGVRIVVIRLLTELESAFVSEEGGILFV